MTSVILLPSCYLLDSPLWWQISTFIWWICKNVYFQTMNPNEFNQETVFMLTLLCPVSNTLITLEASFLDISWLKWLFWSPDFSFCLKAVKVIHSLLHLDSTLWRVFTICLQFWPLYVSNWKQTNTNKLTNKQKLHFSVLSLTQRVHWGPPLAVLEGWGSVCSTFPSQTLLAWRLPPECHSRSGHGRSHQSLDTQWSSCSGRFGLKVRVSLWFCGWCLF